MPGTTELLIIGGIILVLFGASAIPKFFRSIGKAQTEFRKGQLEGSAEAEDARDEVSKKSDEHEKE